MRTTLCGLALVSVTAAAYLALAPGAGAVATFASGSVPNGGCGSARPVTVFGPSRIEVAVASTAGEANVFAEILRANGSMLSTDSYDTTSGGTYMIRVCSEFAAMDAPTFQYSAIVGTGPAGQSAF